MDAAPLLTLIAQALVQSRLEAVLIGNAAAALQGAPVTTIDFDFMFRKTALNLTKLKLFAQRLGAVVLKPYYPASGLYRVVNDERGLQVDFMSTIHGIRSFARLRSRASKVDMGGTNLWVASLQDVIASKKAANRPRDRAILGVLEKTLREKKQLASAKRTSA